MDKIRSRGPVILGAVLSDEPRWRFLQDAQNCRPGFCASWRQEFVSLHFGAQRWGSKPCWRTVDDCRSRKGGDRWLWKIEPQADCGWGDWTAIGAVSVNRGESSAEETRSPRRSGDGYDARGQLQRAWHKTAPQEQSSVILRAIFAAEQACLVGHFWRAA